MIEAGGKQITLFPGERPDAPLVILNTVQEEGEAVFKELKKLTDEDFSLAAISGIDWNSEMSPWAAEPAAGWDGPYEGMAGNYLISLTETIMPAITDALGNEPRCKALAGYSLGGLFALYAMYRTAVFSRFISASGSLWFPGFCEFVLSNAPLSRPESIYISLGSRESKARNRMGEVGEKTDLIVRHFRASGLPVHFETNPGNHFQDAALRMAKGISWALKAPERTAVNNNGEQCCRRLSDPE